MTAYVLRRIAQAVVVAFLASLAVFMVLHLIPGDPALALAGADSSPEAVAAIRRDLGLDQPLPSQYLRWLGGVLRGDLGRSYISRHDVAALIETTMPATLQLTAVSVLIGVPLGLLLGTVGAVRPGSILDACVIGFMTVGYAAPNFLVGILYVLVFALWLGWLPPSGRVDLFVDPRAGWKYLVLPAFALAIPLAALLARFQRAAMREVLTEEYVRTAAAKGLGRSAIIIRHALRNAAIPFLTVLGIQLGQLLGGAVVVESVFAWPGMGRLLLQAVIDRDYVVVQGALLMLTLIFVLVNLVVDLAYGVADPRLRVGTGSR